MSSGSYYRYFFSAIATATLTIYNSYFCKKMGPKFFTMTQNMIGLWFFVISFKKPFRLELILQKYVTIQQLYKSFSIAGE